jgi:hypothetical protein
MLAGPGSVAWAAERTAHHRIQGMESSVPSGAGPLSGLQFVAFARLIKTETSIPASGRVRIATLLKIARPVLSLVRWPATIDAVYTVHDVLLR